VAPGRLAGQRSGLGGKKMTSTLVSSPAHLDYGLDTLFGSVTPSTECRARLEPVEGGSTVLSEHVPAPLTEGPARAKTVVVRVDGRRLAGTVRHSERQDDDSLKLEVEPD